MAAYIHFSDSVEGPCTVEGHKGWIILESWNWSCAREQSGQQQLGQASGVAKFEPLGFNATIGSATIPMFQKMLQGVHFSEVNIECTKNTGAPTPEVWLSVKLEHVLVISISQSIDEDTAADDITLQFSKVEMSIADQGEDGKLKAKKTFKYDNLKKKEG